MQFSSEGDISISEQTIKHGEKIAKPKDPTRPGFIFEGWLYNGELWSFNGYVVTEDMVLVAKWKAIDYVAYFLNEDGTVLDAQENVHYGDQLTYNGEVPVKPNPEAHYIYTFKGWDKDLVVDGDIVFTAQYDKVYAPYEEKYLDYEGNLIYSRYVSEDEKDVNIASLTFGGKKSRLLDGVRLEAEDAYFPNDNIEKYYTDIASNGGYIGGFRDARLASFTIESDTTVDAKALFRVARADGELPLNQCWTLKVNDEVIDLSKYTMPNTIYWEAFMDLEGPVIPLKKGTNTVVITSREPINLDYIDLTPNKAFDVSTVVDVPVKPNEGTSKYQLHGWDIASDVDNVRTLTPHYETATSGLEFDKNKVDVYHGSSKDVLVPSWWNGFTITEIGQGAFGSTDVESVTLPETITYIGDNAFNNAKQLSSINFPNSLTGIGTNAFQNCIGLEEANLNEGLKEIWYHAFESSGLKQVIVPSTVERIHDNVFGGLKAEFIYVPASVTYIEWNAFWSSEDYINTIYCEREYRPSTYDPSWNHISNVVWGYQSMVEENGYKYAICEIDGVTSATCIGIDETIVNFELPEKVNDVVINAMASNLFNNNQKIENVVLPNFLENIPERLFYKAANLKTVTIPDSVKKIGRYAFADCSRLQSIVMPNSVTEAGDHCFENCLNLASVTLSTGLKVIEEGLFKNCDSLVHIEIPEGVETTKFGIVELADNVKSITFPSTITSLGNQTFFYNWGIDSFFLKISPEKWANILESYVNDYDGIDRPTVYYYSETEPAEAGNYWHYVDGVPTIW